MSKKPMLEGGAELRGRLDEFQSVQFCIPPLGTKIQLAEDWTFKLFEEGRNSKLLESFGVRLAAQTYDWRNDMNSHQVTLPAGTILNVNRIYIRNGCKDFDSVTFSIKKCPDKKLKGRFWAKLGDVNKIVCFPIGEHLEDVFQARDKAYKQEEKDRFDFI
jgi:hypothetical protein